MSGFEFRSAIWWTGSFKAGGHPLTAFLDSLLRLLMEKIFKVISSQLTFLEKLPPITKASQEAQLPAFPFWPFGLFLILKKKISLCIISMPLVPKLHQGLSSGSQTRFTSFQLHEDS